MMWCDVWHMSQGCHIYHSHRLYDDDTDKVIEDSRTDNIIQCGNSLLVL